MMKKLIYLFILILVFYILYTVLIIMSIPGKLKAQERPKVKKDNPIITKVDTIKGMRYEQQVYRYKYDSAYFNEQKVMLEKLDSLLKKN